MGAGYGGRWPAARPAPAALPRPSGLLLRLLDTDAPIASAPLPLEPSPIRFGTDGWRGILGVDVTLERLLVVAAAAARELERAAPAALTSREVVIGYDRRFLAPELAEAIASAVRGADLEPLLTDSAVPTPACSWAVVERRALGALVVTASHNPPEWLGLKIKGPFGGSVEGDFTARVEKRLRAGGITVPIAGATERFDALGSPIWPACASWWIPAPCARGSRPWGCG